MKMKYKICVVTTTRAEYGILRPLIAAIDEKEDYELQLVVSGTHLSPEFGTTIQEIQKDGFKIARTLDILLSSDSAAAMGKAQGLALISFSDAFAQLAPDLILLLGDRYEMAAIALCAMNFRIPVAHLHGGEITEGAMDDALRHSITKLSYLHFAATKGYARRITQLGEDPERVYYVGALGVENILKLEPLPFEPLANEIGLPLDKPFGLVTFHPATLSTESASVEIDEVLQALDETREFNYLFTYANADVNGRIINEKIDAFVQAHEGSIAFASLGYLRYLSLMKEAAFVLGNSSSGLVEAPSFHVPTIDIGDRQGGRTMAKSVIHVPVDQAKIKEAIALAKSADFLKKIEHLPSPYGDGHTCERIMAALAEWLPKITAKDFSLAKKFYDWP